MRRPRRSTSLPVSIHPDRKASEARNRWTLAALIVLALAVRMVGIGWGLPHVLEEAYPLRVALRMWGLDGSAVHLDPHFFRYPSLMIDIQFLVVGLVRLGATVAGVPFNGAGLQALVRSHPEALYLAGRAVTVLFGSATVLPVWFLGRRIGGAPAAIVASCYVALNPTLISHSQVIEVDVPLAFFTALGVLMAVGLIDASQQRLRRQTLLLGLVAGLATSTKYPGIIVLVPALTALAIRSGRKPSTATWKTVAVLLVAWGSGFLLTSPYLLLDASAARADLLAERVHLQLGHFGSEGGSALIFYGRLWFGEALGAVLGIAAIVGCVAFLVVRPRSWAIVVAGFLAAFLLSIVFWALKGDRYLLPVIPVAAVLGAVTVATIAARLLGREPGGPAVLGLALFCLLPLGPGLLVPVRSIPEDPRLAAELWLRRTVAPGAMVVSEAYGPRPPAPYSAGPEENRRSASDAVVDSLYWYVPLPMFQLGPERTSPYYDPRLWTRADYFITTGAVRGRYAAEPGRFARQMAFYRWLDATWSEVARFEPGRGGRSSEIRVYRNPEQDVPFARRSLSPPRPTEAMVEGRGQGGEASFYFVLGRNYFGFGEYRHAAEAFRIGLGFPETTGGVTREQLEQAIQYAEQEAAGQDS